jgi:hypothetical protein
MADLHLAPAQQASARPGIASSDLLRAAFALLLVLLLACAPSGNVPRDLLGTAAAAIVAHVAPRAAQALLHRQALRHQRRKRAQNATAQATHFHGSAGSCERVRARRPRRLALGSRASPFAARPEGPAQQPQAAEGDKVST